MNIEAIVEQLRTFSPRHRAYLRAVLQETISHYGPRLLACVLFGSYARRENRLNSDLDFLIILDDKKGFTARMAEFVQAIEMKHEALGLELYEKDGIHCELSPYILMKDEASVMHPIYFDLAQNYQIVHDPLGLAARLIARVKEYLVRAKLKKEPVATGWLWAVSSSEISQDLKIFE